MYTNNEKSEKEVTKTSSFTIASQVLRGIKHLGIRQKGKRKKKTCNNENYKTFLKEIKEGITEKTAVCGLKDTDSMSSLSKSQ